MLITPFWRGRQSHAPAGIRLSRFRDVLKAAQLVPAYRERLLQAGLRSPEAVDAVTDIETALTALKPISWAHYTSLFTARRPSWRQRPASTETRSALLVSYAAARSGAASIRTSPADGSDLYSESGMARATADLFRLSRALSGGTLSAKVVSDLAVIVFSGMDAGVLTEEQRDQIWAYYQVPLFEQLVGTDGKVIAMECEVHSGLHISPTSAVVECIEGEIVLTSLTDTQHPAIRVSSGLMGGIDWAPCECGRVEARLLGLSRSVHDLSAMAVA